MILCYTWQNDFVRDLGRWWLHSQSEFIHPQTRENPATRLSANLTSLSQPGLCDRRWLADTSADIVAALQDFCGPSETGLCFVWKKEITKSIYHGRSHYNFYYLIYCIINGTFII